MKSLSEPLQQKTVVGSSENKSKKINPIVYIHICINLVKIINVYQIQKE